MVRGGGGTFCLSRGLRIAICGDIWVPHICNILYSMSLPNRVPWLTPSPLPFIGLVFVSIPVSNLELCPNSCPGPNPNIKTNPRSIPNPMPCATPSFGPVPPQSVSSIPKPITIPISIANRRCYLVLLMPSRCSSGSMSVSLKVP